MAKNPSMPHPKMYLVEAAIQHLGLQADKGKIRAAVEKSRSELAPKGSKLDLLFIDDATPRVGDHPKRVLIESCLKHLGLGGHKGADIQKATADARKDLVEKAGVDRNRVRPRLIGTIS